MTPSGGGTPAAAFSRSVPPKAHWGGCWGGVENILIEAVRLELGGVWLGIYPRMERVRAIQTAFDLSDAMVPFAAIPVGYPLTAEEAPDRYEADRIHWES